MSDEAGVTISGFLLARIAEDEQEARDAIAWRDRIQFDHPPVVLDMSLQAWPDSGVPGVLVGPERVLAECRAKRAIVEATPRRWSIDASECCEINSFGGGYWVDRAGERHDLATDPLPGEEIISPVLAALAAVWADHPDYRQEWAL